MFECKGKICTPKKPSALMADLYKEGVLDEHMEPVVFMDDKGKTYPIAPHDGVFFFNFRADRARAMSKKILERAQAQDICLVTMTEYDKTFTCGVAFPPETIDTTLAAEISKAGLKQSHIAETEKYPHATYFLNGGREEPHEGEQHIMLASRKDVPTHDLAPLMRAEGIADKALEQIEAGDDFIFINFANADMVGHTANQPAIITGVEEVDKQLQRVVQAAVAHGGVVVITADHGNAEVMIDPVTGEKHTSHTTNLVPFIVTQEGLKLRGQGTLADVAPTILQLMQLPIPGVMTGTTMVEN
jgi:2,3-bisphosphoglycerate-independent phosphoglycerate mutase